MIWCSFCWIVIPQLKLSAFLRIYSTDLRGQPPFHVAMMMMTTLLVYSYCVGVFSSRKIAAGYEPNWAFLAIVGSQRPDFRKISEFRRIHATAANGSSRAGQIGAG